MSFLVQNVVSLSFFIWFVVEFYLKAMKSGLIFR